MATPGRYFIRELEVHYRPKRKPPKSIALEFLRSAADVAEAFRFLTEYPKEHFVAVLLDAKLGILGFETISIGSEDTSLVKPTCAFRAALLVGAVQVIFVHNHPSGDPEPSPEDRDVFRRLANAGRIIGIDALDFVVVGRAGYSSFTELGQRPLERLADIA